MAQRRSNRVAEYVYTERRARKQHECKMGDGPIMPGMQYYAATIGGGGLQSLKFPDYVHLQCKEEHQNNRKLKEARLGNTNG